MEHNEPLRFGHDPDALSKRRISSILKAPRTSMKAFGADQEEHKEETRPIEKRRNSRRVSFATTNNVHVFSKDIKVESPVLAPIENLTFVGVRDELDKKMLHFDTSKNEQITGLDTMINIPLQISQLSKDNFFPYPVLPDEHVDRTMLLGEDTGYMDMTHSHTITIDNEVGINPEFSFSIMENAAGLQNRSQDGIPSKTIVHKEGALVHSDFSDFLASISKSAAQNIVASSSTTTCDLIGLDHTTKAELDKENLLPSRFTKHCTNDPANSQPRGLQTRSCTASLLEPDNMDMTESHTVVIDRRGPAQHVPDSVCGNPKSTVLIAQSFSNDSDDMEMTHSQTAIINFKARENAICSLPLVVGEKSNFGSNDTSGMVMTQVFDEFLQEHEGAVNNVSVLQAHQMSFFNQSQNRNISDQNKIDPFHSSISNATMAVSEDMEITQSNTVVLETKCESFCKSRKTNDSDRALTTPELTKHVKLSGLLKKNLTATEDAIIPNDKSDFMDLTCQTNISVLVKSPSPDDMELTGCNNVAIGPENILLASELKSKTNSSFMLSHAVSLEAKKVDCVQSDASVAHMADDMEMTQCQTVVLESKHCMEQKPFRKSRGMLSFMSRSCRNDVGSREDEGMAHELTGHTEQNRYSDSERKSGSCVLPVANIFHQDLPDCMEIHKASVFDMSAIQVDMELTGCTTIAIDTKSTTLAGASNIVTQKQLCILSSKPDMLADDQMEISEDSEKPRIFLSSQSTDQTFSPIAAIEMDAGNPVVSQKEVISNLTDMGLAKDQAVVTDLNNYDCSRLNNVKKRTSTTRNVEQSEKDGDMEIPKAVTVPFEEQCCLDLNHGETSKENAETGITDQMTLKGLDHSLPVNQKTWTPAINDVFATESGLCVKNDQSNTAKSRRRSLADLQEKLHNIAQCINEPNELRMRSYTTPITHLMVFDACQVDEDSERPSSTEPFKETPVNIESTTHFNLKSFLAARLSLGGITPKLPSRPKSASPNQTAPISVNRFRSLQLETNMEGNIQDSNNVISMIDNEVLPEEDFSDTVVSCLSNNKDEQDISTVTPLSEVTFEANLNESQSEKITCERDAADGELRETDTNLRHGNSPAADFPSASSLLTKTIDDTCFSNNCTNMKCEGISESTLRNSQLDSQIDGTMEHEFDFNKTLLDGSITVNEFLSHFGANSVIHKSRPSALPDNFKIAHIYTIVDLLRDKYIYHPKQRVYEADCQKLAEITEGLKMQMAEQDKPLRDVNAAVHQDMCAFTSVQLQKFGGKLKEQRGNFRKRSKALSHEIKKALYSELFKTTQESKQNLVAKITETNGMLKDLDGCISDLESELESVSCILMGNQHSLIGEESALKAKQKDIDILHSEVTEMEKQICDLEHQRVSLEGTLENLQEVVREFKNRTTTLNSLNEWRFLEGDKNRTVFTFLHNTVCMEVKLKNPNERGWMWEDVERDVDISFRFLLNGETSRPHAGMIHKLLAEYIKTQTKWMQKYPTTQHIPVLLHDVSLVVSRLRLLGEEIHQLKNWGGLSLGILHISCVDTLVEVEFSSVKAFAKFELSLTVAPDYPSSPLQMQKFQNHIGKTRVDQIEDILSSVTPAKNYLTKVLKRIHADLLG
ncbi:uncharacterized protein knl1 [Salminus brasiliensis]|uniref:uncharacterized protein knl1 n=1 Tax=Salminus brasiliensis TaxID=930266 RepID=UPI003B834908